MRKARPFLNLHNRRSHVGTTTMSKAQLIGRQRASYFPFVLPMSNDRFRRKFDADLEYELRLLEELHYHSINDSRYIAEIRNNITDYEGTRDFNETSPSHKYKTPF
ncbi:MAG: hypothetical protein QME49_00990 [bacterium]|nr:hypothetical protein [bacterium]